MSRSSIFRTLLLAGAGAAWGQAPEPTFEVAAIRPVNFAQAVAKGSLIGVAIDPDRVRIGAMPLFKLIQTAYNIKNYQLVGPAWLLDPETPADLIDFDIDAKLPAGATADQVPLMLQSLLRDRFKLSVHRGSTQLDTYALLVGKDGPKFKAKQAVDGPANPFASQSKVLTVAEGKNGATTVVNGATKETMTPGAGTRVETSTMAGLTEYLRLRLQEPVIDKTGLNGEFDINLEILPTGPLPGQPTDPRELIAFLESHRDLLKEPFFSAVEKLGLKLERQKNPVETIVVDHVEKTPSEN
jgi:uncharacterized protein (TIGR03435 family)